jgi:hypothetical protein
LVVSSIIALGWNFGWTKFVIWKRRGDASAENL